MSLVSAWRARSEASRIEIGHCLVRVVIAGLVVLYVSWLLSGHVPPWPETDKSFVWSLAAWLLVAVGFLVATWMWPAPNVSRRALGIILDVGTITAALYFSDTGGSVIVWAYLFIIFGNGFRYGRGYLALAQCVSLVGMTLLAANVPWWKSHLDVVVGWIFALVILPVYVGRLAEGLKAARAKAEEALKRCIEQQPRPS